MDYAYDQVKKECLKELTRDPPGYDGQAWGAFDECSPSEMNKPEDQVFAPLADIVKVLQELDPPDSRPCKFRYDNSPFNKVLGETPGSTFKMDACIRPIKVAPEDSLKSTDAAVVAEFKKNNQPQDGRDVGLTLVGCASSLMLV